MIDDRKAERLSLALPITYIFETPGQPLRGQTTTMNLGGGGIQFALSTAVPVSTPCQVQLTLPDHSQPLIFPGRVSWCRASEGKTNGLFEIGVAWLISDACDAESFARYCHFVASTLLKQYLT